MFAIRMSARVMILRVLLFVVFCSRTSDISTQAASSPMDTCP